MISEKRVQKLYEILSNSAFGFGKVRDFINFKEFLVETGTSRDWDERLGRP